MRMGIRKKPVNLTVDATLVTGAKANGPNLSAVLETALCQEAARRWHWENMTRIAAYNAQVSSKGVWSDGWRER
jgi:post-segregation antitoxin (ccd killing protein)